MSIKSPVLRGIKKHRALLSAEEEMPMVITSLREGSIDLNKNTKET
jgi:hypothetical protein